MSNSNKTLDLTWRTERLAADLREGGFIAEAKEISRVASQLKTLAVHAAAREATARVENLYPTGNQLLLWTDTEEMDP